LAKKSTKKSVKEDVVDAVVKDDETPQTDLDISDDTPVELPVDDAAEADTQDAESDAAPAADADAGRDDSADDAAGDADGDADLNAEAPATETGPAPAPPPPEPVVETRASFIPMVLGGAVAAGLGALGMQYYDSNMREDAGAAVSAEVQAAITEQATRIDALTERLDGVPSVDLGPLETSAADVQGQVAALAEQVGALDTQVTELAARPAQTAPQAPAAAPAEVDLSGIQSQIDALRAALDTQEGTISQMIAEAKSEKAGAEEIARQTMARAAVTRILVALDSGAPFEDALADVEANSDVALPEALAQTAASGAPTVAALSESYPDAAREALAAARSDAPAAGVTGFLSKQLGVRSVAPREGNDPDAILSRMEAAVKEGRLADLATSLNTQ